jgi:hypothetical protein
MTREHNKNSDQNNASACDAKRHCAKPSLVSGDGASVPVTTGLGKGGRPGQLAPTYFLDYETHSQFFYALVYHLEEQQRRNYSGPTPRAIGQGVRMQTGFQNLALESPHLYDLVPNDTSAPPKPRPAKKPKRSRGRPRVDSPSKATLRKRRQRKRESVTNSTPTIKKENTLLDVEQPTLERHLDALKASIDRLGSHIDHEQALNVLRWGKLLREHDLIIGEDEYDLDDR